MTAVFLCGITFRKPKCRVHASDPPPGTRAGLRKHWESKTKFSPCESLGQLSKAIEGIQVRAFTVSSQRLTVELNPVDCFLAGLI